MTSVLRVKIEQLKKKRMIMMTIEPEEERFNNRPSQHKTFDTYQEEKKSKLKLTSDFHQE